MMAQHEKKTSAWWLGCVLAVLVLMDLGACAPLLLSGAVVGGAMVATDRRSPGIQLEDETIELRAAARLREALQGSGHVNVTSFNRWVLLSGEVTTQAEKELAETTVSQVPNVRTTINELSLDFASSMGQRTEDSVLSARLKTKLFESNDLSAHAIKVVVERKIVYLMGLVSEREAQKATELARNLEGVQRVIRVFEIVTEESLKPAAKTSALPAASSAASGS